MGRHLQLLERSTDGRISPVAWALAAKLDAIEATAAPAAVEVRVVRLKPAYVVRLMARAIVDAAVKREAVHLLDFERAGIGEVLARKHFPAALARARMMEPAIESLERAAA